jgi:tRNA threonylcarbamoyladenosine biosynthesis protein TsaE
VIETADAGETRSVGASLGRRLQAGDVVGLIGDLGSGKTTFVQGVAAGLDIPSHAVINSPTYTLLAEHIEGRVPLYHFDVYRLSGPNDLHDLAFDEYFDGSGVVVVEWADRIRDALPGDTLFITLTVADGDDDSRRIEIAATGHRSSALARSLSLPQPLSPPGKEEQ